MTQKQICIFIFSFSFIILNAIIISACIKQYNTSESNFRLHITANSDSVIDQVKKLKVSEKVEKYISSLLKNSTSTYDTYKILNENVNNILMLDNSISNIEIGRINYDKREDKLNRMNAGTYHSINVILGKGKGKNFWTIISPLKEENIEKLKKANLRILPSYKIDIDKCDSLIINGLNKLLAN